MRRKSKRNLKAAPGGRRNRSSDRRAHRAKVSLAMETLEPRMVLDASAIVINEIMYHPQLPLVEPAPAGNAEPVLEEYIELYNRNVGGDPIDLSGWELDRGVDFVFPPNTTIASGEYLIVAADVATFNSTYIGVPGGTQILGGWTGGLSNTGEDIRLVDAAGVRQDQVDYADQGDWADRREQEDDLGTLGWNWIALHDGDDYTLELINPGATNDQGQNWRSSTTLGGSPGKVNSVHLSDIAPIITKTLHFPAIPTTSDDVTITTRVSDEAGAPTTVSLRYRVDGIPPFSTKAMVDDGTGGDVFAGDGVYTAVLAAGVEVNPVDLDVIEFFISASDGSLVREYPAKSRAVNNTDGNFANLMYQYDNSVVDDFTRRSDGTGWNNNEPIYRMVMTATEAANIPPGNRSSDALQNTTFIASYPNQGEFRFDQDDVFEITPGVDTDLAIGILADADVATLLSKTVISGGTNVDAVHVRKNGNIVFSVSAATGITVGSNDPPLEVTDGDLIEYFTSDEVGGAHLAGEARILVSEGIFAGLDPNQDIDAIYIEEIEGAVEGTWDIVSLTLSTGGGAAIGGFEFSDGDLVKLTPGGDADLSMGDLGTSSTVVRVFAESYFATGADIDAVHQLGTNRWLISTTNDETLNGVAFGNGDLIEFDAGTSDPVLGTLNPNATVDIYFSESTFTSGENIDAAYLDESAGDKLALSTTGDNVELGTDPEVTYLSDVRIRGFGSRGQDVQHLRVAFPSDNQFEGLKAMMLNSFMSYDQLLAAQVFELTDLEVESGRSVQVRLRGVNRAPLAHGSNFGTYVRLDSLTSDWANSHYPNDSDGNIYRHDDHFGGTGDFRPKNPNTEDLFKNNNNNPPNNGYFKKNNGSEDDWSDLVNVTNALSLATGNYQLPNDPYLSEVAKFVDINQWLQMLAITNLISNEEGGLGSGGRGDDFASYAGAIDARFKLIPHDHDTVFNNPNRQLFDTQNGQPLGLISQLVRHPAIWPLYLGHYENLINNVAPSVSFNAMIDELWGDGTTWVNQANIDSTKQFMVDRITKVQADIAAEVNADPDKAPVPISDLSQLPAEWQYLANHQKYLRISEIMYNADGGDDLEFIELFNISTTDTLDLTNVRLKDGVEFGFAPYFIPDAYTNPVLLQPGERIVIVHDRAEFEARYGTDVRVAGQYEGNLNDNGERIRLEGILGETIQEFRYKDSWYDRTDGTGFSLVLRNDVSIQVPETDWGDKSTWRASGYVGGAPAQTDTGFEPGDIVINEVLSHADGPEGDRIELLNMTDRAVDISGWYLSDSGNNLRKFRIPDGTVLQPFGLADDMASFDQFSGGGGFGDSLGDNPGAFGLSELGDTLRLTAGDPNNVGENIDALHVHDSGDLIISTAGNAMLGHDINGRELSFGNGDLIRYASNGDASVFLSESIFFGGGEDIDAVAVLSSGKIVFSTTSNAALVDPINVGLNGEPLPLFSFRDGDLVLYDPANPELSEVIFSEEALGAVDSLVAPITPVDVDIDALHIVEEEGEITHFLISLNDGTFIDGTLPHDDGDLIDIMVGATSDLPNGVAGDSMFTRYFSEELFLPEAGEVETTENIDAAFVNYDTGAVTFSTANTARLDSDGSLQIRNGDLVELTPDGDSNFGEGVIGTAPPTTVLFEEDPTNPAEVTFYGQEGGYRHSVSFDAAENGVSLGRHVKANGKTEFVRQSALTFGGDNAGPRTDVVINEILHSPPPVLASDSFDRTDSDDLGDTDGLIGSGQSEPRAWTEQASNWIMSNGRLVSEGDPDATLKYVATIDVEKTDVTVETTINFPEDLDSAPSHGIFNEDASGIIGRFNHNNDFWVVGIRQYTSEVGIWKFGGLWTQVVAPVAIAGGITAGVDYRLSATFSDTMITVAGDGFDQFTVDTSINTTSTQFGVRTYSEGDQFDDLTVRAANTSTNSVEFLELFNHTVDPVPLFIDNPQDPGTQIPWQFSKGFTFEFPQDATIPAGEYVVVLPQYSLDYASFEQFRDDFIALNGIPVDGGGDPIGVQILGPYIGSLDNSGETIELSKPGAPELDGTIPYIVVDRVEYSSTKHGLSPSSDEGFTLNRIDPTGYGDDLIANWTIGALAGGTPGELNTTQDVTPPSTPQNVSVAVVSDSEFEISWDAAVDVPDGITAYRIYRDGVLLDEMDVTGDNATSFTYNDTSVALLEQRSYRVSAVNSISPIPVEGAQSERVEMTVWQLGGTVSAEDDVITIPFFSAVDPISASDVTNYAIINGPNAVTPVSAVVYYDEMSSAMSVRLTTTTLLHQGNYDLSMTGVTGIGGRARFAGDTAVANFNAVSTGPSGPLVSMLKIDTAQVSTGDILPGSGGLASIDIQFNETVTFATEDVTLHTVNFAGGETPVPVSPTTVTGSGGDTMSVSWTAKHNTWMMITLNAAGITNGGSDPLLGDSVFYVGNLVGDLDGSSDVGTGDLAALFGPGSGDVNGDGMTNGADLAYVLANWGNEIDDFDPPPSAGDPAITEQLAAVDTVFDALETAETSDAATSYANTPLPLYASIIGPLPTTPRRSVRRDTPSRTRDELPETRRFARRRREAIVTDDSSDLDSDLRDTL